VIVETREDLAKLHCLHSIFGGAGETAPHLIRSIKEAIEESLRDAQGAPDAPVSLEAFTEAALKIGSGHPFCELSYGIFHLNLAGRAYDPLFVREELVAGLRRIAGYAHALVVVSGLRQAVTGHLKPRQRNRAEHSVEQAMAWIDETARHWKTANCELTIIYI